MIDSVYFCFYNKMPEAMWFFLKVEGYLTQYSRAENLKYAAPSNEEGLLAAAVHNRGCHMGK